MEVEGEAYALSIIACSLMVSKALFSAKLRTCIIVWYTCLFDEYVFNLNLRVVTFP